MISEYCATFVFLNGAVIAILHIIFGYTGPWKDLLRQDTTFIVRYLILAVFLAIAEPIAENYCRFHASIELVTPKINVTANVLLYLYAAVLCLLNFIRVFDNTFWGDEGFSIKLAKMSVGEMIQATAMDVHPPLYYMLIQLLYKALGNAGITYHLSAFIPYTFIIIIACTVVKKRFGPVPSVVLVTMSSIMKNAVVYNVEARMYALAAMFVLIAYIAFYDIIEKDKISAWCLFCLASLGAAYTHYYALISVAFFYLMLIPATLKNKRKMRRVVASYVVTILAYLPWLMILVHSFTRTKDGWWLEEVPGIRDCINFVLDYDWLAVVFAAVLLLFALNQLHAVEFIKRKTKSITLTDSMLWVFTGVLSACGTAAVGLVLSHILRPFFIERYLFPVTGVVYLLFGFCISKINPHKLLAAGVVVMILLANIPAYAKVYEFDKWKDKETNRFLDTVKPASDAVIYTNNQHLCWTLIPYYYPGIDDRYTQNLGDCLQDDHKEIWICWLDELSEEDISTVEQDGYTAEAVFDGFFANKMYHAYKLEKQS